MTTQSFIRISSIFLLAVLFCCAGARRIERGSVRFAITANTYPESPFRPASSEVTDLCALLNQEDPSLVIHAGNLINSGAEVPGIRRGDVVRMLTESLRQFGACRSVVKYLPAQRDAFEGTHDLFTRYTGAGAYYSFNYGNIHFTMISPAPGADTLDQERIRWLEKGLRQKNAVRIVITPRPFITPEQVKKGLDAYTEQLESILVSTGVNAVISSGDSPQFSLLEKGIQHINLPAAMVRKDAPMSFWIINYADGAITFRGRR